MKILSGVILVALVAISCNQSRNEHTQEKKSADPIIHTAAPITNSVDSIGIKAITDAKKDIDNNTVKYYYHSNTILSPIFIESIKQKYKVSIRSEGCISSEYDKYYNEHVDSIINTLYGVTISKCIEEYKR